MIINTTLYVSIDGSDIPGCMALELEQNIHGHHTFRAHFPGAGLESDVFGIGENSMKKIGMPIKIGFSNTANQEMIFNGIITTVNTQGSHQSGQGQTIIFEGYSPTILLENGPSCKAFIDMPLSQIIKAASKSVNSNTMKVVAQPQTDIQQHYTVQYNETAFAFINRISKRYGEWCYFDGVDFVIGNKKQPTVNLVYGSDLYNFSVSMQAPSVHRHFTAHTYKNDENITINTKDKKPSLSGLSGDIYNLAHKMWESPEPAISIQFDDKNALKKQIDDMGKDYTEGIASQALYFKGESINAALFPGAFIKIKGTQDHDYGDYIIIAVTHNYVIGGEYHNFFTAIPSSLKASPLTDVTAVPWSESQAGVVTDNKDPENLGRIKVKLYWQKDNSTPWIRITTPYSGDDKGVYFVPEIGEEVMVGFEGGNAEKPFVIGSLYHGKMKPGSLFDSHNDIKAIKTRSGHTIKLDDKDGNEKITIIDKEGDMIEFDTSKKQITITAPEKLNINAKEINITGDSKISMSAPEISISGKTKVDVVSDANMKLTSKIFDISATKATIKGTTVDLAGDAMTNIKGGLLNLN